VSHLDPAQRTLYKTIAMTPDAGEASGRENSRRLGDHGGTG
jgi:hypothetical protein